MSEQPRRAGDADPRGEADPPRRALVWLAFIAIYFVWGSTYLAIRFAVETLPAFMMGGVRFLIAGAILYGWARVRGAPPPPRSAWKSAAAIGVFLLFLGNGGVIWGATRVASGTVALLVATTPAFAALFETIRTRRAPRASVVLGLLAGTAGVGILFGAGAPPGAERIDVPALSVVLLAAIAWAAGSHIANLAHADIRRSPLLATGMQMLVGGGLLLAAAFVLGEHSTFDPARISSRSILSLAYLVIAGGLVGFTAYVWLLGHVSAAKVATFAYVNPVVAVVIGWSIGGEALSLRVITSGLVIVGAIVAIHLSTSR